MNKESSPYYSIEKDFSLIESSKPVIPQLFKDIGIVYAATHNQNKLQSVKEWVDSYKIIRGEQELKTEGKVVEGQEPDWTDALRVALDKTSSLVKSIRRKPGPKALVIGSDVVVWINGEPKHNLSRNDNLTGDDLKREIKTIQETFSKPSIIMWDIAVAISRKGVKAATGDRIQVAYQPISPTLIHEIFSEDIKGALGRNTRLPLIDDPRFQKSIIGATITPLKTMVDEIGSLEEWHLAQGKNDLSYYQNFPITAELLNQFRQEIIGGLPAKDRLVELEKINSKCSKKIIIV